MKNADTVPAGPSSTPAPHPIWEAVLSPARSVEVRAWLRSPENARQAVSWRGPRGETMLHWGGMADLGLMIDLIGAGIDPNTLDGTGRTPADWLAERLWMTHMEGVGSLTKLNLKKLRVMTDDLLSALWRQGGRTTEPGVHLGELAVRTGLWQTLETWRDMDGLKSWQDWPVGTALHAWPLAPAEQGREDFLKKWLESGFGVDVRDAQNQTPLHVAVRARLDPSLSARDALDLDAAIDSLLAHGANPNAEAAGGHSPLSLLLTSQAPSVVIEHLGARLEGAVRHEGGLHM